MRLIVALSLVLASTLAMMKAPNAQAGLQTTDQKEPCGTVVTQAQRLAERTRAAKFAGKRQAPQTNAPYHLPLTIHIVRQTNGTGGFTLSDLEIELQDLNRLWQPVGVQFFVYGAVDYIDNTAFFNLPDVQANRDALRMINPVANTINVYFTNLGATLCGQASFTSDATQGILMNNTCAANPLDPSTFAHEVGHYFDLYHTHETAFGVECPNGNNCSSAGDKLCDTSADPNQRNNVTFACVYTGSAAPPTDCGSTPYNPPVRNIMSYSERVCRNQFTNEQISKVLNVLVDDDRSNLINSFTKYVALNANPASTVCTYQSPCLTLGTAVTTAYPGDHIFINPGVYATTFLIITKQVFLKNWNPGNGVAQIGGTP